MDNSEEQSFSFAMELACGSVLPMVLNTALELNLLELIKKAGPEASISASELAAQIRTSNSNAGTMIDRILRLLAAHSIVNCCLVTLPDGGIERRYSLTSACRFLTKNEDGVSLAPLALLLQDKIFMESWYYLKEAILKGGVPFDRAHGSIFEYLTINSRFNEILNRAMFEPTMIKMKKVVEIYKGFEGLTSLVYVGGGNGALLKLITTKYPLIQGINFDLPHALCNAPSYPGVTHISGDMFVSIPKADAIFMKRIILDLSDTHCEKLFKNCYDALPDDGKVILADMIIGEDPNGGLDFKFAAEFDVLQQLSSPSGKERTEKEFHALAKQAGFKKFKKVCCVFNLWIMEFQK